MWSWIDYWTRNNFFLMIKDSKTIDKSCRLNNSIVSVLIFWFWSVYYGYIRQHPYFRKHTLKYIGVKCGQRDRENDKVNMVIVNIWRFRAKGIQKFFVLFFCKFSVTFKLFSNKKLTNNLISPRDPCGEIFLSLILANKL